MTQLQQLNVQYYPAEDRLILRLRMEDASQISLWLTRRYCKLLLSALTTVADKQQPSKTQVSDPVKKAIDQFHREAAVADTDFSAPFQSDAISHPLGSDPVLVTQIEYKIVSPGRTRLSLGAADGKNINLNLNTKLLHSLTKLLLLGAEKADWDLAMDKSASYPDPDDPNRRQPLH